MSRVTEKMTYTDGQYFCNRCDTPHEGESLAEACFDDCPGELDRTCDHCPTVVPKEDKLLTTPRGEKLCAQCWGKE